MFVRRLLVVLASLCSAVVFAQVAGQNINMVSGTTWPAGDPYLQRQNEPSMAVSSRNPEHLLGGANDYRTVDIPNPNAPNILGDAWLGVYSSMDGGETWKSTLLPGYPQDISSVGTASPLHSFTVATDPTVRAGTHGMFYYSGLVFNRGSGMPSGVFVATFQDQNNKGNGDAAILATTNGKTHGNPFSYIGVNLVDTGTSGQFLDKPWIAVDIPRAGRTATCKINGQTFSSGYVYVVYTQFNGSQNNPASKIKEVTSTNCGATWSQPQVLSQSQKLAQGTVATIDPTTGNVHVAWRQIAVAGSQNQPDAIQYAVSTNGGSSFTALPPVYTFTAPTTKNPYPAGAVFDQAQVTGTTFRSLDVPTMAVDGNGRVWVAFSQRFNGPTAGTYGSRIMVTTLPKGSTTWTSAYIADNTALTSSVYGHQFNPSLSFAYGKMMLAWFDSRRDNLESILQCAGGNCKDLSQVTVVDQPLPGSTIADPRTVFTPTITDPNSGVRHTIDVFGGIVNPSGGPTKFSAFQISQYPYYVNDGNNGQIEQGFFNPPNLPMFVQGMTPFIGDYIDIAAQNILPNGNSWMFNTQATDSTGATNAPDFHITWTDNRDVVPPPVKSGSQDWTKYDPPNSGSPAISTYSGTGSACPGCQTMQNACTTVTADDGTSSSYSGDRNQNVYTSRVTNGLVVRFKENAKPLSSTVPQRSFSLLVKNTVSPLSTTPLDSPSYYRILLGVTATSQNPTGICNVSGVPAFFPTTPNCYIDIAVNPKTTFTQAITASLNSSNSSINVLVAQIQGIPVSGAAPVFARLQALAVINGDATNPSVADPDFLNTDNDNPDAVTPYGALPIAAGEQYDPTVDSPPDPTTGIFTPKIGVPAIFTPKIGTVANSAPAIETPTVFTPKIFTPKISSIQVANPTIVNTITNAQIFTPKIFTPKIVSPDIFTPKITDLGDTVSSGGSTSNGPNTLTDYSWRVANKGNTSASYSTTEFAKSAGVSCCPASCSANPNSCSVTATNPAGPSCSVCQLVQHKVYETPVANRDATNMNATCDLTVQQQYITVANVPDPAFSTGSVGVNSPSDPTTSTLSLSPGEGNRVTLRVLAPPVKQTVASFKTVATSFNADKGQNTPAGSLTIATSALPVAVVGQNYSATTLASIGGFGTAAWSVPPDPTNPVAATLPISPEPLHVSPLTLNQSGQISTNVITASPGAYIVSMQVQDSAVTPSLDVQQVELDVNQFTISNVDVQTSNFSGAIDYMKEGENATVAVTVSSQGPATATNIVPTITVNAVPAGTPSGPTPVILCGAPSPARASIIGSDIQIFNFICTAVSGNGYVTFTANATGHYVNAAGDVLAIATPVSQPSGSPSSMLANVTVDTVNPTLMFNKATPTPNQFGWNNTPVTFSYSTNDNLSTVHTSIPNPLVISTEGRNLSGQVTVTDYAKNSATITAPTEGMSPVNIDLTAPTIQAGSSYPPGTWTNQNVTVIFTCNDNLSGPFISGGVINPIISGIPSGGTLSYSQQGALTSIATVTLTAETASTTLAATCQDFAGNKATLTQFGPIMIDKTPPVLTLAATIPSGFYTAGAWTNQNVTVTYACVDNASPVIANSGVAVPPISQTFTSETSGASSDSSCTDAAGNKSIASFSPIRIDKTPPVLTVSAVTADTNPYAAGIWTNQNVTVTYACVDNASILNVNSGLAVGSPTGSQTFSQETSVNGTNASGTCSDNAGNIAINAPLSFGSIKIDKTPPTVTATANLNGSPSGPAYTAGTWTNQSVVVTFACSDSLSGVKAGSTTGDPIFGSQGIYNANGSCMDNAGNTGNGSFGPVQIDTTIPAVLITSPSAQTYVLNQQITPNFTCGDNSGGDTTTCTPNPLASPYPASAVGPATFSVHVVDQAGNVSNPDPSVNYLVIYNFTGFQSPLQPAVMLNPPNPATPPQPSDSGSFTIGATIPIAWQLQDAANTFISDPTTLTSIVAIPNPACAGTVSGPGTTLYDLNNGHPSFTYDGANNRFVFTWNTTGTAAGCYNLIVTTNDTAQWSTIVHF